MYKKFFPNNNPKRHTCLLFTDKDVSGEVVACEWQDGDNDVVDTLRSSRIENSIAEGKTLQRIILAVLERREIPKTRVGCYKFAYEPGRKLRIGCMYFRVRAFERWIDNNFEVCHA